ncbi:LAETG motif-containing sortase-dependent surface protein [Kitasatospora sp. NPDC101801]|uniref:LAETG motif-containing sortase-dependent surface protein n=1 Tax=Kitasatospora sp. NPDC101801 TaxID=3364103 RepID=UPI0037F8ED55
MKFRTTVVTATLIAVSVPAALSVAPAFAGTTAVVRLHGTVAQLEQNAADARAGYEAVLAKETARRQELTALLRSGWFPEAIQARQDAATAAVRQAEVAKAEADRVRAERNDAIDALPATTTDDERVAALRELGKADLAAKAAAATLAGAEQELAAAAEQGQDWRVGLVQQVSVSEGAVADALAVSQAADRALADARAAEAQRPTPTPTPTPTPAVPTGGTATATAGATVAAEAGAAGSVRVEDTAVTVPTSPTAAASVGSTPTAPVVHEGELAETGSSSASTVLAIAGVATMALGAGAVVVARRRKGDADR